jgi:hypothetical protein
MPAEVARAGIIAQSSVTMDIEHADKPLQERSHRPERLPTSTDALIGKHNVGIVANQCSAGEMLEDGALVAMEDSDVDILMVARLPAQPGIRAHPPQRNQGAVKPASRSRT